jgi:sarcosine oxidase subunit beta
MFPVCERKSNMPVGSGLNVFIIGGGLVGCGCGYYLTRAGARVTILEENFLASGASGANAGLLSLGMPERPDVAHLYAESRRLILEELEPEIGDFEMVRSGILYVAMEETELQALKMRAEAFQETRIAFTELTPEELLEEEPRLSPDASGGLLAPDSGNFNPFLLSHGLARSMVRNGGRFAVGKSVKSIEKDGEGFLIKTGGETFSADVVVLANGWQATGLAEPLGITLPVVPARGQIIITEPLAPFVRKAIHSTRHIYMRQTVSGTCQIGSHTEFVGSDRRVTLEKLGNYAEDISKMIPLFANVRMLRAYAGLRPLTPDSLPIVEKAPGMDGLVLACGHSRTGASLSVVTGKIVTELLLEGRSSLDISPWSLDRFGGKTFEECTNGR